MKRFCLVVAVVLSAFAPSLHAALGGVAGSGYPHVVVNGFTVETARDWSGGGIGATIAGSSLGAGVTKKHVADIAFDSIVIESTVPFSTSSTPCSTRSAMAARRRPT